MGRETGGQNPEMSDFKAFHCYLLSDYHASEILHHAGDKTVNEIQTLIILTF